MSEEFDPGRVVVVMYTLYQRSIEDQARARMAGRTIKSLTEAGYRVIVADSGFHKEFASVLQDCNVPRPKYFPLLNTGVHINPVVLNAFSLGAEAVVWMEAEQDSAVPFIPAIAKPILDGKADIAIRTTSTTPSRDELELELWLGPIAFSPAQAASIPQEGTYGDRREVLSWIFKAMLDGRRIQAVRDYHSQEADLEEVQRKTIVGRSFLNEIQAIRDFFTQVTLEN